MEKLLIAVFCTFLATSSVTLAIPLKANPIDSESNSNTNLFPLELECYTIGRSAKHPLCPLGSLYLWQNY
jgi:hypothetical protein